MIEIKDLSFTYGGKKVLDRFSLTVPERGITALSGPSGCGKTTLLRCIAGLESGAGEISGVAGGETALLFQEDRLLPWRTAEEQLTDVLPAGRRERAQTLLKLVGLEEERQSYPCTLSGGMGRRLALGRCLALDARLYLLDEPFAGVDLERARGLMDHLRTLDAAVLLVSHQPEILALARRVVELEGPPLRVC